MASGTATTIGASSALWATVHDWSGVAMTAGVALHTVLHARWLVHMTGQDRRRGQTSSRSRARRAPAQQDSARAGGSREYADGGKSRAVGSPDAVAATSLLITQAMGRRIDERSPGG